MTIARYRASTARLSAVVRVKSVKGFSFALLFLTTPVFGQAIYVGPDGEFSEQTLKLPYAFWNEKFGFALGYVHGVTGYPQKQSALIGTAMVGSEGSAAVFLLGRDIRLPRTARWFLDTVGSVSYLAESDVYINGNTTFPNERAGSNDSDPDNFVRGEGWDNLLNLRFKYLLPIGRGRDDVIGTYRLDRGLPISGAGDGSSRDPRIGGKTYFEVTPFYRFLQVEGDDIKDTDLKTNGFEFSLYWDNRDFFANPSRGHSARFRMSRDFGWFDSSDSWTALQFEFDKYFSLGATDRLRQRVIALSFWTSDSPTWEVADDGEISHRPPPFAGSTLGGLFRLRGFPAQRFNDKAAIHYATELRLIPEWNPFDRWPWLQKYVGIQWLQFVPFVDVGRVAPTWRMDELHSDMKWDVGLGIRAWAKGLVVRVDTAVSDEEVGVQMMVSHPFQF